MPSLPPDYEDVPSFRLPGYVAPPDPPPQVPPPAPVAVAEPLPPATDDVPPISPGHETGRTIIAPPGAEPYLPPGPITHYPPPEPSDLTGLPVIFPDDAPVYDEDTDDFALEGDEANAADYDEDVTVVIDESEVPNAFTRELEGAGKAPPRHFPRYCSVSHGGYVQGVTGPVGVGIRELELIVNPARVYDDFAATGHAPHSYHHCGLAVDLHPERWIFDLLYPARSHILELLTPWGLWDNGKGFHDSKLEGQHKDHIHVALNLTADQVDEYLKVPRRKHLKPGQPLAPKPEHPGELPPIPKHHGQDIEDAWNTLMTVFAKTYPSTRKRINNARADSAAAVK